MQGMQFSFGILGRPGTMSQGFVSLAAPDNPIYVAASISAQLLYGYSLNDQKIDLSGWGNSLGAGYGLGSASYAKNKKYELYGAGAKITGRYM
jgi:hypothetical protein